MKFGIFPKSQDGLGRLTKGNKSSLPSPPSLLCYFFMLFKFQTKQPQVILSESENPGTVPFFIRDTSQVFYFSKYCIKSSPPPPTPAFIGKFRAAAYLGEG